MDTPELTDEERAAQEASSAHVGCECAQCREARLGDGERIAYTAHDMADAWTRGWMAGYTKEERGRHERHLEVTGRGRRA